MTIKNLTIAVIAAMGFAFSAFAADAPGVGSPTPNATIADFGSPSGLNLVDNFGDTYHVVVSKTGSHPPSGTLSGTAVACAGNGNYSISGTFLGTTVHWNNTLTSGGNCVSFVIDCVVNMHTKSCSGTYTNEGGTGGPIVLTKH